jgi:hypothetical protein
MQMILLILLILMPNLCNAAAPTRAFTYVSNTPIDPAQNNTNENALYSYLQTGVDTYASGSITGDAISNVASISYGKLALTNSIVNADISSSAAIVGSKLDLSSPGIIGATSAAAGTFTTLTGADIVASSTFKLGSANQGDVLYDNGTSFVRKTPGTNGQVWVTGGTGANPNWANSLASVLDYGSSASSSTSRQATALKVAFGNVSVGSGTSQAITNLGFTGSTSYTCTCTYSTNVAVNENPLCVPDSGAQMTIYNNQGSVRTVGWFCLGV